MEENKREIISPKSEKQYRFINSEADCTVFGGAAGAGKSYLGVMDFIPHIKYKNFRGVITRRTTPQLRGAGGILDTALQLYKKVDPKVRWKAQEGKFVFASGAEIYLRHFEHPKDADNFTGLQTNHILVDEGQQYEENMVTHLMSRLRNPACPEVSPRMRITCNPLKNSYLHKWIEWYLDEEGYPREDRDGVLRYFIRIDGKMVWGDTREELIEQYSTETYKPIPMSFKFISATVFDNPVVMEINPAYVGWLQGLGRVEKAKLLYGCWSAEEIGEGYWKSEWCEVVDRPPLHAVKRVRAWDVAGSIKSELNPDPDYTVGVLISKDKLGIYYIEDVVRFRARFGEVFDKIVSTAKEDGDETLIVIPQDAGAAGKAYAMTMIRDLSEHGFYAKAKPTNQSKITRFAPFCSASEAGSIKIVKGDWNEDFIQELTDFDGGRKRRRHDDQVDAAGDAFMYLCSTIQIPTFSIPDMTTTNSFNF